MSTSFGWLVVVEVVGGVVLAKVPYLIKISPVSLTNFRATHHTSLSRRGVQFVSETVGNLEKVGVKRERSREVGRVYPFLLTPRNVTQPKKTNSWINLLSIQSSRDARQ